MADVLGEYSRVNLWSDPIYRYIRITKGGDGGVPGEASEQDLLDHPWLQRLRRIHQLQSAWWVFATAEHSRFQHSLGAMHLAGEWGRHLYPTLREVHADTPSEAVVEETLRLAGLLHDCGHGPFGHFFDENYLDRWGIDHEDVGRHLITGPLAGLVGGVGASPHGDFEAGEAIDPRWIAFLISRQDLPGFEPPDWLAALQPLLTGPFSADNMDYVPRDSYICGVAVGPVDVQRILHYSFVAPEGLALHSHAAEALFMFLSARLYLYHQVYFHRTVRRIDLQLREVFRETISQVLGGNPLERLDVYQGLTEWSLLSEVDRWRREAVDGRLRELGQAWGDLVGRRLKWTLVYSTYLEGHDATSSTLEMSRDEFAERIRSHLPRDLSSMQFEVDVASQQSGAVNPATESGEILLYDPLTNTYDRSGVLDLFRRLPVRMALFRVFAQGPDGRAPLSAAAEKALRP
ncbi:MAG TPA: HD domain-containing protein [Candidatus Dormibacteraeota bacterium]